MSELTGIIELAGKAGGVGGWTLLVLFVAALWRGWILFPRERDDLIAAHKKECGSLSSQLAEAKERERKWEGIALRGMKIADAATGLTSSALAASPPPSADPRAP